MDILASKSLFLFDLNDDILKYLFRHFLVIQDICKLDEALVNKQSRQ